MILATGLLKFARRMRYSLCLLYIDLDSLKVINDQFGHIGGDTAIISFARLLTSTFRDSDVLGRLGGDEFVVLLVDATENDLRNLEEHLRRNVDAYNIQAGPALAISFSMGTIWEDAKSELAMEEILAKADQAMYLHKQRRKRPV